MKVFVYGSLKRGFHNNPVLDGARFLRTDKMRGYLLHDLGAYPAAVPCIGDNEIHGELYEVNNRVFARLDSLEGYPEFYDRFRARSVGGCFAWVYYLSESDAPVVADGVWRDPFVGNECEVA